GADLAPASGRCDRRGRGDGRAAAKLSAVSAKRPRAVDRSALSRLAAARRAELWRTRDLSARTLSAAGGLPAACIRSTARARAGAAAAAAWAAAQRPSRSNRADRVQAGGDARLSAGLAARSLDQRRHPAGRDEVVQSAGGRDPPDLRLLLSRHER